MSSSRFPWPLLLAGAMLGAGALGTAWFMQPPSAVAPSAQPARPVTLFLADAQGMFLVPAKVTLEAPAEPQAWARSVFDRLRAPGDAKLLAPVPRDAELLMAGWKSSRWTLDVKLAKPLGSTDERLLVGALVRTFISSWPDAREVQLRLKDAQGRPFSSQHLDLSLPLTVADVGNTLEGEPAGGLKTAIWWPSKDSGGLLPVQVVLAGATGIPPRDAFERLIAGPPAETKTFLTAALPVGVEPRWETLDAGVARISVLKALPSGEPGRRFVEATVLTLTEFPDVRSVQFVREGQPLTGSLGPFRLDAPIPRPVDAPARPPVTP